MALILKSSKLISKSLEFACLANSRSLAPSLLRWKNVVKINKLPNNKYIATATAKVMNVNVLEKSINQLDLDARYKNNVSKKDVMEILNAVKKWGCITYPQTLLLIKCCNCLSTLHKPEEKIKLSTEIWQLFENLDLKLDISHYNLLLSVFLESEHNFSPKEFLEKLNQKHIEPNNITFQRLLKAHCQQGDITAASDILEAMKAKDIPVNEDIFNSLILGHSLNYDFENADLMMNIMKEKGIPPSPDTYLSLICGYAKKGDVSEIKRILKKAEEKDLMLLDRDYLEIIYNLAMNGHVEDLKEFTSKLKGGYGFNSLVKNTLYRLLHKNLDSTALKLYKDLEEKNKSLEIFLIDYYVMHRSTEALMNLCADLKDQDSQCMTIMNALKRALEENNLNTFIKLINVMEFLKQEIRPHYFWPLIVRASHEGKSKLLNILTTMKKKNIFLSEATVQKVVLPYYEFEKEWENDLDMLRKVGVKTQDAAKYLLVKFLKNSDFQNAKILAETKPIKTSSFIVNNLVECLKDRRINENNFVHIFYCLLHDQLKTFESVPREAETNDENDNDNESDSFNNSESFCVNVTTQLVRNCANSVDVFTNVLKALLEKKIPLPNEAASLILEKFDNPEIKNLVQCLTAPDLQLVFDEAMLSKKKKKAASNSIALIRYSVSGNLTQGEEIWKKVKSKNNPIDCISMMLLYIKGNDVKSAMEILETINAPSDISDKEKFNKLFMNFLMRLSVVGELEDVEKALKIAVENNVCHHKNYLPLISFYLNRHDLNAAVDFFCKKTLELNYISGSSFLVERLIKAQDAKGLQRVIDVVVEVKNENFSFAYLMFSLAQFGGVNQIKKLLEAQDFKLSERDFVNECKRLYKLNSIVGFENLLAATKNVIGINRTILYEYLLNLYIKHNKEEELKNLCSEMQGENIFPSSKIEGKVLSFLKIDKKDEFMAAPNKSNEENVLMNKKLERAVDLIEKEEFSELNEFIEVNKLKINTICYKLIKDQKISEYIKFLNALIESKSLQLKKLSFTIFPFFDIFRQVKNDSNLLEDYKLLALDAFKELNLRKPLTNYWVMCLSIPDRKKEAEEIYEKYLKGFSFDKILMGCIQFDNLISIDTVLASETLRGCISESLPQIYEAVIKKCITDNNLDNALSYLSRAVKEGLGELIPKTTVALLNQNLKEKGQPFPFSDLVKETPS